MSVSRAPSAMLVIDVRNIVKFHNLCAAIVVSNSVRSLRNEAPDFRLFSVLGDGEMTHAVYFYEPTRMVSSRQMPATRLTSASYSESVGIDVRDCLLCFCGDSPDSLPNYSDSGRFWCQ